MLRSQALLDSQHQCTLNNLLGYLVLTNDTVRQVINRTFEGRKGRRRGPNLSRAGFHAWPALAV